MVAIKGEMWARTAGTLKGDPGRRDRAGEGDWGQPASQPYPPAPSLTRGGAMASWQGHTARGPGGGERAPGEHNDMTTGS